ncbi:MAG: zinc ABC transporter ATP-binding protein ZnuC [Proteobacteria bacterium]|nr:zinc ABC transporter ATP-binding protein ZnuC [Pseudomonadota bacterium]
MQPERRAGELLVDAQNLSIRYADHVALDRVDLAVHAGEIVTVIGPNGAGKTSLIRAVLGLIAPSTGAIRRRPGLKVGYVPQGLHIDDSLPLTIRRFLGLAAPEATRRVGEALAEVGAERVVDSPVQAISGGEMKRVLLARALLRDPDLLALDEPTSGVDVTGQAELYRLIQTIRDRRGCGVLLVSHNLHVVMAATDQVLCLNRHVCCRGQPEAVSRHPEYLALFGPHLATTLAVYTHEHDHRHGPSGEPIVLGGPGKGEDRGHSHG